MDRCSILIIIMLVLFAAIGVLCYNVDRNNLLASSVRVSALTSTSVQICKEQVLGYDEQRVVSPIYLGATIGTRVRIIGALLTRI